MKKEKRGKGKGERGMRKRKREWRGEKGERRKVKGERRKGYIRNNMNQPTKGKKKKRTFLIIFSSIVLLLFGAGFLFFANLNRLLTNALLNSFNSNVISDVYELKFESLKVDLIEGNIRVKNVSLKPRSQPLHSYPYINSSFTLRTKSLKLLNVQLMTLINTNDLKLEKIEIDKPEVDLTLDGKVHFFLPRRDTIQVEDKTNKKFVDDYALKEFRLSHAAFKADDNYDGSKFTIKDFNILLEDLSIKQKAFVDEFYYKNFELNVGEVSGQIQKGPFRNVFFKDLNFTVDSFKVEKSADTLIYLFNDCKFVMHGIDLQTADSLLNLKLNSIDISYKDHSITADGISLKPTKSFSELQKNNKYQKTDQSITVGSVKISDIRFDSLVRKKIFIGRMMLDSVDVTLYKDNSKAVDPEHLPEYPGQSIAKIPLPLRIDSAEVTNLHLLSIEIKKDGVPAKVSLNKGVVHAENITNLDSSKELTIVAEAYIDDKVKFNSTVGFSYAKPQINLKVHFDRFNLTELNKVIGAYSPAKIDSGIADEISFSGVISRTQSSGTMKFLYSGLVVDMKIKDKAKWKSAFVAFAANEYLSENNPPEKDMPAKIVKYNVQRDMHKGFPNIIIKSAIAGVKETMILSGENKKAYKAKKKALKEKN
jgi:hypothetical protein